MRKLLAASLMTLISAGAMAKDLSTIQHPNCKLNQIELRNGDQFGSYGYTDLDNKDTQAILSLLASKGYEYDQAFIAKEREKESNKDMSGITVYILTDVVSFDKKISYIVTANGVKMTYISQNFFTSEETTITVYFKELAKKSQRILRASRAKEKDFVLNFAKGIPECVINPDVVLEETVKR